MVRLQVILQFIALYLICLSLTTDQEMMKRQICFLPNLKNHCLSNQISFVFSFIVSHDYGFHYISYLDYYPVLRQTTILINLFLSIFIQKKAFIKQIYYDFMILPMSVIFFTFFLFSYYLSMTFFKACYNQLLSHFDDKFFKKHHLFSFAFSFDEYATTPITI